MSLSGDVSDSAEITVRLFASLRETLGLAEFQFDLALVGAAPQVEDVRRYLIETRSDDWQALAASEIRIAVNQEIVDDTVVLQSGDELAFFPPVTGG